MRAYFEHIIPESKRSVVYKYFELPFFDSPFHFHAEYELTFIIQGEGLRYVGTNIEEYISGELVLLGSNLPHYWQSKKTSDFKSKSFVIQFQPAVFENAFQHLKEFDAIKKLLKQSSRGIFFENPPMNAWKKFINKSPIDQFLELSKLLNQLSQSSYRTITSLEVHYDSSQKRLQKIITYVVDNFTKEFTLDEIASMAGLSKASFCRYFKNQTGMTLLELVTQYRLEAACQSLLRSNKSVKEIAFEVGFNDVPHFHRAFKKNKGTSPLGFRKSGGKY